MFTQLETLKKLNQKTVSLLKRRLTLQEQIEVARADDTKAREQLVDMDLPPEKFTEYSNAARAAQRRRANLEDKLIDLEESATDILMEMRELADGLLEATFPDSLEAETEEVELDEGQAEKMAQAAEELESEGEAA